MADYTKHIGRILLLVFTTSLMFTSVAPAYHLVQLTSSDGTDTDINRVICNTGMSVAGSVVDYTDIRQVVDSPEPEPDTETSTVSVNNCNTSLHLFSDGTITLPPPPVKTEFFSGVSLLSSQLFVQKIADPPRHV